MMADKMPPLPTEAERFAARFKLRIISVLTVPGSQWTREQAIAAAQSEWDAFDEPKGEDSNYWLDCDKPEDCARRVHELLG